MTSKRLDRPFIPGRLRRKVRCCIVLYNVNRKMTESVTAGPAHTRAAQSSQNARFTRGSTLTDALVLARQDTSFRPSDKCNHPLQHSPVKGGGIGAAVFDWVSNLTRFRVLTYPRNYPIHRNGDLCCPEREEKTEYISISSVQAIDTEDEDHFAGCKSDVEYVGSIDLLSATTKPVRGVISMQRRQGTRPQP